MPDIDYNSLKDYTETGVYPANTYVVKDGYIIKNTSGKTVYNGFRAKEWTTIDVCPQRTDNTHQWATKAEKRVWDMAETNAKDYTDTEVATVIEEIESGGITPTNIIVENEAIETTCFPLFVVSATGSLGPKTNTSYTYNPVTNTITATLTGNVTGNVSGTAGNLSGTPTLPDGTRGVTQPNGDGTTKLATNEYVDLGLATKQDPLVSGTNIKTLNSVSLLGSGDITVQMTLVSGTNIKTVNSTTLLGSGDVVVQATLVSGTNIKTINGDSVLGSGDLVVTGAQPDIPLSNRVITSNQTITAGYSAYISGTMEVAAGIFVEIGSGALLEIG